MIKLICYIIILVNFYLVVYIAYTFFSILFLFCFLYLDLVIKFLFIYFRKDLMFI